MSDIAIRVEGLGKRYRIGQRERYLALRDVLTNAIKVPLRLWHYRQQPTVDGGPRSAVPGRNESIWALKDVSFEIKQGEVVGIIGRNGAGKTTLLKILSRITKPTEGYAEINGRVGSLLEVGTGFHPELTGRENICLNGAILGMKKAEIDRKFDEIVAFAEIEKFIDTPVKRYSSGMYVRLAFAVAAHLEPEILLVDEVLAVGDVAFQKKCLGKMGDVAKEGRTVLFVSHNMGAVESLTKRGFVLSDGRLVEDSNPRDAIASYLEELFQTAASTDLISRNDRSGEGNVIAERIEFMNMSGEISSSFEIAEPFKIAVRLRNRTGHEIRIRPSISIYSSSGAKLISCDAKLIGKTLNVSPNQSNVLECHVITPQLASGKYSVNLMLLDTSGHIEDWIVTAGTFIIRDGKYKHHVDSNPQFPILTDFDWVKA